MSTATSMNYKPNMFYQVKSSASGLVDMFWSVADLIKIPLIFAYTFYRLVSETGVSFLFGMSFMYLAIKTNEWVNDMTKEIEYEL